VSARKHVFFLLQGVLGWGAFWLVGLPRYFQQYSPEFMGVVTTLLSVAFSLGALFSLKKMKPQFRMNNAFWMSFYFTVPLAILDWLYCSIYLGDGADYLIRYWYLTVFYASFWFTFVPTAWLLTRKESA
jgi:hypothetical protein